MTKIIKLYPFLVVTYFTCKERFSMLHMCSNLCSVLKMIQCQAISIQLSLYRHFDHKMSLHTYHNMRTLKYHERKLINQVDNWFCWKNEGTSIEGYSGSFISFYWHCFTIAHTTHLQVFNFFHFVSHFYSINLINVLFATKQQE